MKKISEDLEIFLRNLNQSLYIYIVYLYVQINEDFCRSNSLIADLLVYTCVDNS